MVLLVCNFNPTSQNALKIEIHFVFICFGRFAAPCLDLNWHEPLKSLYHTLLPTCHVTAEICSIVECCPQILLRARHRRQGLSAPPFYSPKSLNLVRTHLAQGFRIRICRHTIIFRTPGVFSLVTTTKPYIKSEGVEASEQQLGKSPYRWPNQEP